MAAVSRELARQALLDAGREAEAAAMEWEPALVRFPHPEMTTLSFTGRVIAPCIFAACMFGAVTQVRHRRAVIQQCEAWRSCLACRCLGACTQCAASWEPTKHLLRPNRWLSW